MLNTERQGKKKELSKSAENREVFASEYNDLISIEHDLETEKLSFPNKIEDGFSAADLTVLETFFDLSGLEEKQLKQKMNQTTQHQLNKNQNRN